MIMFYFRSGTLIDLIQSAPSLQLKECLVYLVLVVFGIELLVGGFILFYLLIILDYNL